MDKLEAADFIWKKVLTEIADKNKEAIIIHLPDNPKEDFYVCTDMYKGVWRDLHFDSQTLELLPKSQKKVSKERFSTWLIRSNFRLHVGAIGGLTTKIIYFISSLICASLPVTGLYIWWGRRKTKK